MFKKLFTIGMLAGVMLFACNANAQTEKKYAPEYPNYSFWSNWSLGGELIYNMEYGNFGGPLNWRHATNAGVGLFFEKELNYVWAMRLGVYAPGLWKGYAGDEDDRFYDRFQKVGVDFKFSLNDAFRGCYDPECGHSWYLIAGIGATVNAGNSNDTKRAANGQVAFDQNFGWAGWYLEGGLGWSVDVCKHGTFYIQYVHDVTANPRNFLKTGKRTDDNAATIPSEGWQNMTGNLSMGYMINFGPTQKDLDIIAQRALLTQENFDKMSNEIDGLRNDLRDAKTREAKLMNRINELENAQKDQRPIVRNDNSNADSLRRIIEGYENNKHNFYALPFSITYDVDQYTVSEDQMNKVKAIAEIMKDNDCNFDIIGYCDYSGSDAYNQKLSEKRAENVKKLLVNSYGVNGDRLTTSGKGKSMSFGDIKNAINRRVSFYRNNK